MDVTEVLTLHSELELPEGLDKRHTLNVTDCTSELNKQLKWHEITEPTTAMGHSAVM